MAESTPDLSEFYRLAAKPKPPCPVKTILVELDLKQRAQLNAALAMPSERISVKAILAWIEKRRQPSWPAVVQQHVTSHRMRKCSCSNE